MNPLNDKFTEAQKKYNDTVSALRKLINKPHLSQSDLENIISLSETALVTFNEKRLWKGVMLSERSK